VSAQRLPSSAAREMDKVLRKLGYTLERNGNHLVYSHPDFAGPLTMPATPSDWRAWANALAMVKRRHPAFFVQRKSDRPRRQRSQARLDRSPSSQALVLRSFEAAEPVARALVMNAMRMRCVECARPFVPGSTIRGRGCPRCGGELMTDPTEMSA